MSIRTITVALLAVICGLSAAWGVSHVRRLSVVTVKPDTTPIVVAAGQLSRGRMVGSADVKICRWPKDLVPEGTLTNLKDALNRAVVVPLFAGEPLFDAKLATLGAGRGLAALIPKGMRAYTIQASRVASNVAGFILPGNRVDVLLTLKGRHNDGTGGGSTTTLLQAVEILAVDQRLDAPAENKMDPDGLRSVTLLVTPEQASLLDLGQSVGQLTLSLRNPEDGDEADTRPATLAQIRFRQEKPLTEPPTGNATSTVADEILRFLVPYVGSEKKSPKTLQILTLRGNSRGLVHIVSGR